jgi:hypothetical protein
MNKGVEILLARMDSNPEEFFDGVKWEWVMRDVNKRVLKDRIDMEDGRVRLPFLSDEEVKALYDKMESLRGEQFTHKVMSTLLEDGQELSSSSAIPRGELFEELKQSLDALFQAEYEPHTKTVGYGETPKPHKIKLNRAQAELVRRLGEQQ